MEVAIDSNWRGLGPEAVNSLYGLRLIAKLGEGAQSKMPRPYVKELGASTARLLHLQQQLQLQQQQQ